MNLFLQYRLLQQSYSRTILKALLLSVYVRKLMDLYGLSVCAMRTDLLSVYLFTSDETFVKLTGRRFVMTLTLPKLLVLAPIIFSKVPVANFSFVLFLCYDAIFP